MVNQDGAPNPGTSKIRAVIMFGPPGAGKGTIGRAIADAGNMCHVCTGDMYRDMSPNSKLGQLAHQYLNKGMLIPDDLAFKVWRYYIDGLIATHKFFPDEQLLIVDGMPRTVEQAKLLDQHIQVKKVIVLDTDHDTILIERLKQRSKWNGRIEDVDVDVLEQRMRAYRTHSTPVLDHYSEDLVSRFDCEQGPLLLMRDVLNELAVTLTFRTGSSVRGH